MKQYRKAVFAAVGVYTLWGFTLCRNDPVIRKLVIANR